MTQREQSVFEALVQGGEAEVIVGFLDRVKQEKIAALVQNKNSTEADLRGVQLALDIVDELRSKMLYNTKVTDQVTDYS